jgi:hypothetical protein
MGMLRKSHVLACSFLLAGSILGCDNSVEGEGGSGGVGGVGGEQTTQPEGVPVFSKKAIFLSVGEPWPIDYPMATDLQYELGGAVYVLLENDAGAECVGSYLPSAIEGAMAEMGAPYEPIPCVLPDEGAGGGYAEGGGGGDGMPAPFTGQPGTNPMPSVYREWFGADQGGCGVWAVAMCNRILGIRAPSAPVVEDEWDDIGNEIGLDASGASQPDLITDYYAKRGFVASMERFDGTAEDYEELTNRVNAGCDVKLQYARRTPQGTYEGAHIETVVSASEAGAVVNSWGHLAQVKGGALGGFEHSRDTSFRPANAKDTPVWPPGATEVWVYSVCEASEFQQLMEAITSK